MPFLVMASAAITVYTHSLVVSPPPLPSTCTPFLIYYSLYILSDPQLCHIGAYDCFPGLFHTHAISELCCFQLAHRKSPKQHHEFQFTVSVNFVGRGDAGLYNWNNYTVVVVWGTSLFARERKGLVTSLYSCCASVLGKRPWVLKHNSLFWPALVLSWDQNSIHLYI